MKNWLPHNVIRHHIHLLQLENYHLRRFLRAVVQQFHRKDARAPDITWTYKLSLVTAIAGVLQTAAAWLFVQLFSLSLAYSILLGVGILMLTSFVFVVFVSLAVVIVWPIDWVLKKGIVWLSKRKLQRINPRVVAVAGSYGKTTMKQTIATMLEEEYSVAATPGNKNTPLGVARAIRNELTEETEVFVVEMGEYQRGDIKELCEITTPEISIVTGINEAHLARFGSIENTMTAIFEVVEYADEDATIIANADDERVRENIQEVAGNQKQIRFYSAHNHKRSPYRTTDRELHTDGSGISFELMKRSERIGTFKVPHMAEYIIGNIIAALLVGEAMDTPPHVLRSGISHLTPAEHRLEPIAMPEDIVVIDDSYNGNPDGAAAAISTLAKFADRRKIYVTPGLVEMGDKSEHIHRTIGRNLADVADIVVLVDTSAAVDIKNGLELEDYDGGIVVVDSMEAAQGYLSGHVQEGDVVLFQNDWPQNYQ